MPSGHELRRSPGMRASVPESTVRICASRRTTGYATLPQHQRCGHSPAAERDSRENEALGEINARCACFRTEVLFPVSAAEVFSSQQDLAIQRPTATTGSTMNATRTRSTESQPSKAQHDSRTPTILAVGAAGAFAGLVVPELAKRGASVRGLVRDSRQAEAVRKRGAADVAIGDLRDRASLEAALKGVGSVFYIAPAFMPNEAEVGKGMVAAAKEAGVRRFVFSSVIDPSISALVNHSAKAPVEEAIIESGMEYALLQPTLFVQGIARSWSTVLKSGVFAEPWSTETRFTRVDYRDVAEVGAIALTEERLLYGTYQLCAEGNLNRKEVAALMGEVLGRTIEAVAVSRPRSEGTGRSSRDEARAPMTVMFDWYDKRGLLGNALVLRAILGREPRTLRAYLEELAAQSEISDRRDRDADDGASVGGQST
jgi:uncharacterized protein YbjT (DUF2867 family)